MAIIRTILIVLVIVSLSTVLNTLRDKVVIMDVGQGDSVLLQSGTEQVLIDGGPGAKVLQRLGEEMPWFDRKIEVIVLTHPQRDHMEGLLHVVERYEVGLVLMPDAIQKTKMQEEWLSKLIEKNIPYRFAWSGQQIKLDNLTASILGPFDSDLARKSTKADINNASVILRADFHDVSFLFTGDAEKRVERMLIKKERSNLNIDVLKVGHHGSKSSTMEDFLKATTPKIAVISVGKKNKFGHPSPETLDRLNDIKIFRTDEIGSVRFLYEKGWRLSDNIK